MGREPHVTSIVHDRERGLGHSGSVRHGIPGFSRSDGQHRSFAPRHPRYEQESNCGSDHAPEAQPHLLGGLPRVVQDERVGRCHQAVPLGPGPDASRATRAPLVNMPHLSTRDSPERACGDPPLSGDRYPTRTPKPPALKRCSRSLDVHLASTSTHHQPNTNPTPTQHPPGSTGVRRSLLEVLTSGYGLEWTAVDPLASTCKALNSGSIPLAASRCSRTSEAHSASTSGPGVRFDGAEMARVTCLSFLNRCAVGAFGGPFVVQRIL